MPREAEVDGPRLGKPVVHIITTGGTIASRIDPATGTAFPVMHAQELLAEIPELSGYAEPRMTEFALVPSFDMTPGIVARLARDIRNLLAAERAGGIVVTHGTDTMEESAFALDLLIDCEQPVVMTGAMRNASQPGADGPRNLVSAVRTAAARNTRGLGVAVVMNDQVHAPRYVTKSHTTATDTMISPGVGPIGTVDDGGVWLRWLPKRLPRMPDVEPETRVYLIRMAAGMDDLFLRTVFDAGARRRDRRIRRGSHARELEAGPRGVARQRDAGGAHFAMRAGAGRSNLSRRPRRDNVARHGSNPGRRSFGYQGARRADVRARRWMGPRENQIIFCSASHQ